jgi:Zn-finger nucleic acid-binding protein
MELTCPKCHGTMRTYERNGVHVDQCSDCRGIFLDRGELDRLIDAENTWHGSTPPAAAQASGHQSSGHQQGAAAPQAGLSAVVGEVLQQVRGTKHGTHQQSDPGYYKKRKKESFLSDLFG